jgi:hypothetical protein
VEARISLPGPGTVPPDNGAGSDQKQQPPGYPSVAVLPGISPVTNNPAIADTEPQFSDAPDIYGGLPGIPNYQTDVQCDQPAVVEIANEPNFNPAPPGIFTDCNPQTCT